MAHHTLEHADRRGAGTQAPRRRHRHAGEDAVRHPRRDVDRDVRSSGPHATRPQGTGGRPHRAQRRRRSNRRQRPGQIRADLRRHDDVDAHGAVHAATDGARRRADHHRQGRHGAARRSPPSTISAAHILRWSAAPPRCRQPGSRRSRMWISRNSIPNVCGSSASGASAPCWSRWIRMAVRSTRRSMTPRPRRAEVWRASAISDREGMHPRHRHSHPRRRRRRPVRGAACQEARIPISTSPSR